MICALLMSLVVTAAGSAQAWWDGKWKYRKKITLDASASGADIRETLSDFPLLVRLHSGKFRFPGAGKDGADIRLVAADDRTSLKYHIEQYDPAAEMALIWVRVPRISAGGRLIWIYYGCDGAAAGQEDAGGTYDLAQAAVYHFAERSGRPLDATAYRNHGKAFTGKLDAPLRHRPGHDPERRRRAPDHRSIARFQFFPGVLLFGLDLHGRSPG